MGAVLWLIDTILAIYFWVLIAQVVMSWLYAFNMINPRQPVVYQIGSFLHRATEPVLGPIRRILPNLGGLDISPLIAALIIIFLRKLLVEDVAPALM